VAVRLVVRDSFKDILGGVVVSLTELKALEEALFEVVYPSFGGRCGWYVVSLYQGAGNSVYYVLKKETAPNLN
jgi:hypothetical protein